jgi:hypothetical protein
VEDFEAFVDGWRYRRRQRALDNLAAVHVPELRGPADSEESVTRRLVPHSKPGPMPMPSPPSD